MKRAVRRTTQTSHLTELVALFIFTFFYPLFTEYWKTLCVSLDCLLCETDDLDYFILLISIRFPPIYLIVLH